MPQPTPSTTFALNQNRPGWGNREADGGWCLSWCKEKWWGEMIAVGCGPNGIVNIYEFPQSHRFNLVLSLIHTNHSSTQPYAVSSVAWAPTCGRSYHLIATGSRDGKVRIWKLLCPPPGGASSGEENKWSSALIAEFDEHKYVIIRSSASQWADSPHLS
jgi:nucleoporin SEH1